MSNQQDIFRIIKELTGQTNILTIPRAFVQYTGSIETALFLSQVVYWSDKGHDGWFYKTYQEWADEICLSEYALRKSVNKLTEMGILETKIKKANGSPTVHYHLKHDEFISSFLAFFQNGNCEIKETKLRNQRMETLESQELITETTTEITHKKDVVSKKLPVAKNNTPGPFTQKLLDLTRLDFNTMTRRQDDHFREVLQILLDSNATEDRLDYFERYWRSEDWRGESGKPPTLTQVCELWRQFEEWEKEHIRNGRVVYKMYEIDQDYKNDPYYKKHGVVKIT